MATYVRFECGQEDRVSHDYGPFEFVQLTYRELRVSPEGDTLAVFHDGWWQITEDADAEAGTKWSDVIIYDANGGN